MISHEIPLQTTVAPLRKGAVPRYTAGGAGVTADTAAPLLAVADMLQLRPLARRCEILLAETLSLETLPKVLQVCAVAVQCTLAPQISKSFESSDSPSLKTIRTIRMYPEHGSWCTES